MKVNKASIHFINVAAMHATHSLCVYKIKKTRSGMERREKIAKQGYY